MADENITKVDDSLLTIKKNNNKHLFMSFITRFYNIINNCILTYNLIRIKNIRFPYRRSNYI